MRKGISLFWIFFIFTMEMFFLNSINSSSYLFWLILLPAYFYQFLFFLIFINSSSYPNLSISPFPFFIDSSSFLFLSMCYRVQNGKGYRAITHWWFIHRLNRFESLLFCFFLSFFNRITVFHQRTFPLWKWKKFRITKFPFLVSNLKKSIFLLYLIFINSSFLFLWIPSPSQIYQFLLFLTFINSTSSLFLSILFFISINSSSSLFLSILFPSLFLAIPPLPYEFFMNFSSFPNLFSQISPFPYFYQFLLFLISINSSSTLILSIPPPPYFD